MHANRFVLSLAAVVLPMFACARASSTVPPGDRSPPICSVGEEEKAFTLSRIKERLDTAATDTGDVNYRRNFGLNGIRLTSIHVVEDSATCAAAIVAYARISHPDDSVARHNAASSLKSILVVRLSTNRYILNANEFSDWRHTWMFLVDSTFSIIDVNI